MMNHVVTLLFAAGLLVSTVARAELIPSAQIGNDPEKERLCASRAGTKSRGKVVPFAIDPTYVSRVRSSHPDVSFIAIDDGISPQLIEYYLLEGTGKYEPAAFSPEQQYWHLIKPEGSGIDTPQARSAALELCEKTALSKLTLKGFDHNVQNSAVEITLKRAGTLVAGKTAERYDVAVEGTAFYKSAGPDLKPAKYTCLLSRALAIRAVQTPQGLAKGRNEASASTAAGHRPEDASGDPISDEDVKTLWPINVDSQEIPKFRDKRTNFLDADVEKLVDEANQKYEPSEHQQVIDFCRLEAFKKKTGMLGKRRVAKSMKDPQDALRDDLQEEFMYCANGMLRSWQAEEARSKNDQGR
jgi:hypothetical protein